MQRETNEQRFERHAINEVPSPFGEKLKAIFAIAAQMRDAAKQIGVKREFTPDGRFMGDVGEVIAKLNHGVHLHPTQTGGEDGKCSVSGKSVEVKLRSDWSSPIWVTKIPDRLVALYLSPKTLRWGTVYNGPGNVLSQKQIAKWNDKQKRFETTLAKLIKLQNDFLEKVVKGS